MRPYRRVSTPADERPHLKSQFQKLCWLRRRAASYIWSRAVAGSIGNGPLSFLNRVNGMNTTNARVALVSGALVCLLLFPAAVGAAPTFEYEATLVAEPPLARPVAVTLDPSGGVLCVTDEAAQTLELFDSGGFHEFRTSTIARISLPRDGSLDANGGFVFTDAGPDSGRTLRRLNFYGEPVAYEPERPMEGWSPRNLVVARDGHFVTLDASGLLAKHDAASGVLIWSLPLAEPGAEMADVMGRPAEAPDGRFYVPNSGARIVQVVSADGEILSTFGEPGTKRGQLAFPVGVAFGPAGSILVLDRMRHRVLVFDSNHDFVTEFGRWGASPGELFHPVAMTASSDGRVWIAQGFRGRVQTFRLRYPGRDAKAQSRLDSTSTRGDMHDAG